jgi:RNA-directed DNA polymerase
MLLERMSAELLLPVPFIQGISASASYRYREYVVVGRSGSTKTVYHPARQLKALQRWLLRHVVLELPVHAAAQAYEKNRGIRKNSELHRESRFLLRMDFADFFPSLTETDVKTSSRPLING